MTDQTKMREEFAKFQLTEEYQRTSQQLTIGGMEFFNWQAGYQAATAQSAEKIARLEAKLAAAELSNTQLREKALLILESGEENCGCVFCQQARELLAQPISTEALDAYVAKMVPPGWKVVPIEPSQHMLEHANTAAKAANISISGRLESAEAIERVLLRSAYVAMLDAAPLPPAPEKE